MGEQLAEFGELWADGVLDHVRQCSSSTRAVGLNARGEDESDVRCRSGSASRSRDRNSNPFGAQAEIQQDHQRTNNAFMDVGFRGFLIFLVRPSTRNRLLAGYDSCARQLPRRSSSSSTSSTVSSSVAAMQILFDQRPGEGTHRRVAVHESISRTPPEGLINA